MDELLLMVAEMTEEIKGMRDDFREAMSIFDQIPEIVEQLKSLGGPLGYSIQDVNDKLHEIHMEIISNG